MSSHGLRHDKTCQNCGYPVDKRFCSRCGQENTENRQSFGHLLAHFLEDLTHYEGRFWRSMRYLYKQPGHLTNTYLQGKRNRFVMPVRLYIFLSFVTFLLPYLLPDMSEKTEVFQDTESDSLLTIQREGGALNFSFSYSEQYRSVRELDSSEQLLPPEKRMGPLRRWIIIKGIKLSKYSTAQLSEKFLSAYAANFPKALFIFLPLFAFVIWLFHDKKKWFYFDHAIFTLHYFSFLLLTVSLYLIGGSLFSLFHPAVPDLNAYYGFGALMIFIYSIIYFRIAHRRIYNESKRASAIRSGIIYFINLLLFVFLISALGYLTLLSL